MVPIKYNVRSLFVRKATTIATAVGVGFAVWVFAASLMLSAGVKKTLGSSGSPDVAVVLRKGSDNELASGVEDTQISVIRAAPGVAKGPDGEGLTVGEVIVVSAMEKIGASGISNMQIRGVPADGMKFRPHAKIVQGRPAKPGTDEAVVGARIAGRFKGVGLGEKFDIKKNRPVTIVGVFEDEGSSYESEVWADVDTVRTSFGRTGVSSVRARLESPSKFDAFKASVESDKRLGMLVMRENEYYEKQSEGTSIFVGALGVLISVFCALGAMIGAMNTMYAAIANRKREIGILRALGFSRSSILVSFVLESTFLSVVGGAIGVAGALAMGSVKFSMMNFASWSEIVFGFEPTPTIIGAAIVFAGAMGFIGGFLPAVRAAGTSPVTAMRGG
ncbi:MAG TPA: FtsX-like permease family protein [Polyangiaceae bacterium]|nr:FtsX-like permease family protein [Polyangiaceae bacterium]